MKTPDLDTFTTTVKDKDTIVKKAFKTANAIGKRGAGAIDKAGGRKVKDAMSKGGKKAVEGGIRKIKDKLTGGKKDGASKTKEAAKPASDGDRAS